MSDRRDDDQVDDVSVDDPKDSLEPVRVNQSNGTLSADSPEGEDEEETWTNQPGGAAAADEEPGDEDLLDEEDDQEAQPVTRKVIQNGRDVICEELPGRASRAKLRMKPHLTCTLVVELTSSGEKFLFDWKGEEPKVAPVSGPVSVATAEGSDAAAVDSIISLTEQNLMAVRSGDLNPQVAMLADKIKVKGKIGPAVYLFNLIAPRVQQ
jgi:hypothetical protein